MTSPRNFLLIALLFIGYLLWMQWQEDYNKPTPAPTTAATAGQTPPAAALPSGADVPNADASAPAATSGVPEAATPAAANLPNIVVTTDVLRVEIDPRGGNVVVAELLAYPQQPKDLSLIHI